MTHEFIVQITTTVPEGTDPAEVDVRRAAEAVRAKELTSAGNLVRLWRPVGELRRHNLSNGLPIDRPGVPLSTMKQVPPRARRSSPLVRVKISRKSWHYRLYRFVNNVGRGPRYLNPWTKAERIDLWAFAGSEKATADLVLAGFEP